MNKEEEKASKKNIIIMVIIGVLFIVAIATRWDYTKKEIIDSFSEYIDGVKGK